METRNIECLYNFVQIICILVSYDDIRLLRSWSYNYSDARREQVTQNENTLMWLRRMCSIGDVLTHWGRMTHICVSNPTIIDSDNGLSPSRRQAIIGTNAGILLIRHLEINFSEPLIGNQTFSFKKMQLKISSAKWRPFCLGLNVLIHMTDVTLKYCRLRLSSFLNHGRRLQNDTRI